MTFRVFLLSVISTLFLTSNGLAQTDGLPHYLTPEEEILLETYQPPRTGDRLIPEPPDGPVRVMAEWEELQGILITWASYSNILQQVVDHAQEEGLVYIVCNDSNQVKNSLTNAGVPLENLVYIETAFNSVWVRDYGPWTIYNDYAGQMSLTDWVYNRPRPYDDVIPVTFADLYRYNIYEMTQPPNDLVATGGNFMTDGHGTAFSSELVLNENPGKTEAQINAIVEQFMGVDRYIKLENLPYDGIHHIDMHMKLLDEETLLVGQYPEGVADGPQIEQNLQYILDNVPTCFGNQYDVVRIPMPPDQYGYYPHQGGDYRTFTNSLIVNKTVIIPIYETQYDTTAYRIYQNAMPGYNIVGIDSDVIIPALGTIHCITKEIGADNTIFISHEKLKNTTQTIEDYEVRAFVRTMGGVSQATLYWEADVPTLDFEAVPMTEVAPDSFVAYIPAHDPGTRLHYYIEVEANNGKIIRKPMTAPDGFFRFNIESDPTAIEEPETPGWVQFELFQNFPNPVGPKTSIAYTLAKTSDVELTVYNMAGQKVQTLVASQQSAGYHTAAWNGTNQHGEVVSSGVYFYQLQADDWQSERKRMVLMR